MILLYHGIVEDSSPRDRWCVGQALPVGIFQRQIEHLRRFGEIVSLEEYLFRKECGTLSRDPVFALTFDDGLASTYENVGPFLKNRGIPATFFVSTSHLNNLNLLWFCYLNALCFENVYPRIEVHGVRLSLAKRPHRKHARRFLGSMAFRSNDPIWFCEQLARTYPIPESVRMRYRGMTSEQFASLREFSGFEIGSHTVNHPFLTRLSEKEQAREIVESNYKIMELTKRRVRYFAYPGGDYNQQSLRVVQASGIDAAFATEPKRLGQDQRFEIRRVGIYSPSILKLGLKAVLDHIFVRATFSVKRRRQEWHLAARL